MILPAAASEEYCATDDAERDVLLWRVEQFGRLGFTAEDVWQLARSDADLGQARRLARGGCPPALALAILL